jgi:hypothetical protein
MFDRCVRFVYVALLLALASTPAFAQSSSTSSLSGVVVDTDGGAIPGATVVVKNNATSVTVEAVSNASGQFSFPGLDAGTYTVTVSLTGFKTFVANDVRLLAARPGSVTARLEIGALTETVEVKASTELVQTQSPAVTTTLSTEQLSELPLISRNALYSVSMLPGVSTTGGPRNALINGLPNNTVNITVDGVGTGNMLQSGDGFFSMVTPRMDAVEEITVTGAVPGVGAGSGSTQIAFVTRSGSNQYEGSLYHYWRDSRFNSNNFFDAEAGLPKNDIKQHQYGGRIGGPLVLPGFDGRGKAFFFLNMEHFHQPSSVSRTRNVLRDSARAGIFSYERVINGTPTVQTVNLLALAAANGQISAVDPTVASILDRIHAATQTTGALVATSDPNTQDYRVQFQGKLNQYAPTGRLDVNLTDKHRLSATYLLAALPEQQRLPEQRRAAVPGVPQQRRAELVSHDRLDWPALDAVDQHGERVQGWLAVVAQRLLRQHQPGHVRRPGRICPVVPQHRGHRRHERVHACQLGTAEHDDVEREQRLELAQGRAQPDVRRIVLGRAQPHEQLRRRVQPDSRVQHDV